MKVNTIIFIVLFLFSNSSFAQELNRRAFLGIHMVQLDDSIRNTLNYDKDHGIYLPVVLGDATFGVMGVAQGTVLEKLNGETMESFGDVQRVMGGVKAGDPIKAVVFENGASKAYKGKAVGRPFEEHPHAKVEYGTVSYEDNMLRSILYLPDGVQQPPVVFFLQGYTCQSIEMQPHFPAKQLIDQWIGEGYAVYLVEKPGMGDSDSKIPCMEIDFNQEVHAFSEAYASLRKNTKIDASQIFLFGHSMGGVVAPLIAKGHTPKGIMVYGIVGKNWYDYMRDIYIEQPLLFGTSEAQVVADNAYNLPFIEDLLMHRKPVKEMLSSPVYGEFLKEEGIYDDLAEGYYIYRHIKYWQTLTDVDIPDAWVQVKAPVCVLHGEYDIQAIHPKYGEMIATNVKAHGGNATFRVFPKSEHGFLKFDSREELMTTMNNGTYGRTFNTHFNQEIGAYSLEWMKGISNNKER